MQPVDRIDAREEEIARIAHSEEDIAALQQHIKEIIEGKAFKGSQRSRLFLRYVMDQAIAGRFESLKERVIGSELFGRSPSYETGEDAIVRVAASDVRKRLLQHYVRNGAKSPFHLSLPIGSYIPEITRNGHGEPELRDAAETYRPPAATPYDPSTAYQDADARPQESVALSSPVPDVKAVRTKSLAGRPWLSFGIPLVVLNLVVWGIFWMHSARTKNAPVSILPWSAIFGSSHDVQIISADPNMPIIEQIDNGPISLSDYANRSYIAGLDKLSPDENHLWHIILRTNKAGELDTRIIANVAALAQASSRKIVVRAAREIQLSDLQTDDNFILLGSPRTNPWTSLFSDQLDFRFVFDKNMKSEFIQNVHPRPNDLPVYVPTARGWATGDSYAIVAFIQNPDQNGQVLLLAGADSEGTEAAGKLATDLPRLSAALQQCGISPSGPLRHFELLLRLNTLAGTPSKFDVVTCHILPGPSAQKP
jgi:hypothetical protein